MIQPIIKKLTINGKTVTVYGISTGYVAVKQSFRDTKRKGIIAILSSFLDKKFTEWMPIWVWVIEHEEGVFVIDTGENAGINDPNYFKSSGWFENWLNTSQFRFKVNRADEIDQQLEKIGIPTNKVDKVILTHLHLDHIDGLRHFSTSDILVNQLEWEKPYGDLPKLYPDWLKPTLVPLTESYKTFDNCAFLTTDKSLVMVQTAGHTYGHTSVLLQTDQGIVFFAGDVVYYQQQLLDNKFSAAEISRETVINNYTNIKKLAQQEKLVLLPSHEIAAIERLNNMTGLFDG